MGRKDDIVARVRALAEPLARGEGLELVDVELTGAGGRTVLRLSIDRLRPGGSPPPVGATISLDDCSAFSRVVSTALDVEDPVEGAYDLEVSSPGLDRPLRTAEHFAQYAGKKIRLKTYGPVPEAGGRKTFVGTLVGMWGDKVRVEVDGTLYEVPHAQVSKANLEPVFDR